MKRRLIAALLILAVILLGIAVYLYRPTSRITVVNNGSDVIAIRTDGSEMKTLLGQNETSYFDSDLKIQLGNASISVGRRVEVVNTGSDIIQITYLDTSGSKHTTMLGEGGSGYFSKTTPINIGEVNIRIGSVSGNSGTN